MADRGKKYVVSEIGITLNRDYLDALDCVDRGAIFTITRVVKLR